MEKFIEIIGAKSHNLKNIHCKIPRGKITTITGVSGSGKSTLAFDTLFAEGQRRYIESLSTYARQFLDISKPDLRFQNRLLPFTYGSPILRAGQGIDLVITLQIVTELHGWLQNGMERYGSDPFI